MKTTFLLPLALLLPCATGCSNGPATPDVPVVPADGGTDVPIGTDVPPGTDVQGTDVPPGTDVQGTDVQMMPDSSGPRCGTMRPVITGIRGTEGLVIAADGTIYYSQANAVGRMQPGMPQEDGWVSLGASASTVWGIALDAPNHRLYVGSPTARRIFVIDTTAAAPTATMLSFTAGGPNGLTMGPDGAMYYSDFSGGHVYRVDGAGTRTQVTTTTIMQPNGVAFGSTGDLYVDSYATGTLLRLTLTAGMESARATVARNLGNPDGLAFDAMGRIYIGDNGMGRLIRLDADGTNPMILRMGISAAANIEFGAGALNCNDIYVASGGVLVRYEMGTTAGADVPWHH